MDKKITLFLLILVLALSLRSTGIDRAMVHDESIFTMTSVNLADTGKPLYIVYPRVAYWTDHPHFSVLMYALSIKLLGVSDLAFRIMPLIFGLLTIFLTYLLGKYLFSERIGLIAAFLMAISRYHIFASQRIDVDGGFVTFLNLAMVFFFLMYMKHEKNLYIVLTSTFLILSVFAKLHAFIPVAPLLLFVYLNEKDKIKRKRLIKKGLIVFSGSVLASIFLLYIYSVIMGSNLIFTGAFVHLIEGPSILEHEIGQIVYDKLYYIGIVTWQLTPFLSILLLCALIRLKKDPRYYLLASWIILTFLLFGLTFGGDKQRTFSSVLPPVFILTAAYLSKIEFNKEKILIIVASLTAFLLALLAGINDLMAYHNPLMLGFVYLTALAILLFRKKAMIILLSGFIGLSLYAVYDYTSWQYAQSYTVEKLVDKVEEFNFPLNETWSNKDIAYYLYLKQGKQFEIWFPDFENISYMKENNIRYLAYYSVTKDRSEAMAGILPYCDRSYNLTLHNYLVGIVCEIKDPQSL